MKLPILSHLILSGLLGASAAWGNTVDDLLTAFKGKGAGTFDSTAGEALWQRRFPSAGGPQRACTSCHTGDLTKPGRHAVTGKAIEPLAPSVNTNRLTDRRQIEKWLMRNCKWTLGRECTAQEKGDLLSFLRSQ